MSRQGKFSTSLISDQKWTNPGKERVLAGESGPEAKPSTKPPQTQASEGVYMTSCPKMINPKPRTGPKESVPGIFN